MSPYLLAMVVPAVRKVRIPVTRDQAMLLMIALNELLLGLDTYLAHSISGTIVPGEWVPILFGPIAGLLLLAAGLIAIRRRMLANQLATLVFSASILVGLLGTYFHLHRAILFGAAPGQQLMLSLLVWAPPLLGPITFTLFGVLGLSAAWQEEALDNGVLVLPGGLRLHMPYSKTRAYFFLIGLGMLITLISAVMDHAHTNYANPWVWVPTAVGLFATAVIVSLGFIESPTRIDLTTYTATALLLMLTGALGFGLHIYTNTAGLGGFVLERFIRNAPLMAPMLFANIGLFALLILLDPGEQ